MPTQIRRATSDDLPKIKAIIGVSFPRFFRYFAWHSISDQSEPTLVYEADGSIAGFTKLIEFSIRGSKCGCILWIAVHPSFRRRGVAFALTEASIAHFKAQNACVVFASTQHRNNGALLTLGKAGFRRIGFVGLWHLFGLDVFEFYRDIWFAPSELVLVRKL